MTYGATLRDYTVGGADDDWIWLEVPSIGPGQYRRDRTERVGAHGALPLGGDYSPASTLTFELEHDSGDAATLEAAGQALRAAWSPSTDPYALLELTVEMASGSYLVFGRPAACEVRMGRTAEFGYSLAVVEFDQLDPLWYGATLKTALVNVPTTSGGFTTPAVTPAVTTTTGTSGDAVVENEGTAPAKWIASLSGPLTNPRILIDGYAVSIDGTLAAGEVGEIDSQYRTFTVGGIPRQQIAFDSVWRDLPAGEPAQFSLRADAGDGTATLYYRDTYH